MTTQRNFLRQSKKLSLLAFDAALKEASVENLWALHGALQKNLPLVSRGKWGSKGSIERRPGRLDTACPLNWLYAAPGQPLEQTIAACDGVMRSRGFEAKNFYAAWDAGLIGHRELYDRLDRFITSRTLAGKFGPRPSTHPRREGQREYTILVVNDEAPTRGGIIETLRNEPYRFLQAADAKEAWSTLLAHDDIDAILSDDLMPGESGIDFLPRVRERWPQIPIALTTGYIVFERLNQALLDRSIDEVIPLPWENAELIADVRDLLEDRTPTD